MGEVRWPLRALAPARGAPPLIRLPRVARSRRTIRHRTAGFPPGLHSVVVTQVEEAPVVGKGIVGAITSEVGRIGGRNAVIARSLGTLRRGAITHADGVRLAEAADQARELGIPFVFFVASSGADVLDGVAALHGWGRAAAAISRCSGQVPVIAAATGPVVSGPALLLGLSDLVVMSSEAVAFVSGPQMVAEIHRDRGRDQPARRRRRPFHCEWLVRGAVRGRGRCRGRAPRLSPVQHR